MKTNSLTASIDGPRVQPNAANNRLQPASRFASLWTLYVLTLRQHLRGKRWMVAGGLFLFPAAMAIVMRLTAPNVPLRTIEFLLAFMLAPLALMPLVALLYASGIIRDEQEEQTLTYLLVRPIPKAAMYIVKLLATMTTAVLLTCVFTFLTYAAIYIGASSQPENIAARCMTTALIHSLAVITYCSLFGLMSLFTRRVLVAGVVYTAVFEGLLANLPFGIRLITVVYYTRLIAYRLLSFSVIEFSGQTEDVAANGWQFDLQADPNLLEHPQLSTCLLVLFGSTLVATLLAAWLCSQREFHVKTPENA